MRNKKGQFIKGHDNSRWIGKKHSEETKNKMSIAHKGNKHSEPTKQKMSKSAKEAGTGKWMKEKVGKKNPFYGKKHTKETLNKLSGKNNHGWRGGRSFKQYGTDWTITLKKSIRERDKYICGICGKEQSNHCHHVDYNKKNCNPNNLITLCRSCHSKTNSNRTKWQSYFKCLLLRN